MADHFVELHCQEQATLLVEYLSRAFPPTQVPFSITARQKPPQAGERSGEGEEQAIRIRISGIGDHPHVLQCSANPVQYLKTHPDEPNATFMAARVTIEQAVEGWREKQTEKRNGKS